MIRIRLRSGLSAILEGTDEMALKRMGHQALDVSPREIEMIELSHGPLSTLDGHATGTTDPVRGLLFEDDETGVKVQIIMPLAVARELGDVLGRGKIIQARSMPQ